MIKNVIYLLRFFESKEYLRKFLNGRIYLNSPHYYRMNPKAGIGDKTECCYSFLNDVDSINELQLFSSDGTRKDMSKAEYVMFYDDEDKFDAWLSCWFILSIPDNSVELIKLLKDIDQCVNEFGKYAAILPINNVPKLLSRFEKHGSLLRSIRSGAVCYDGSLKSNSRLFKKDVSYAYQREYRFALGECDKSNVKPIQFSCGKLADLIFPLESLKISVGQVSFEPEKRAAKSSTLSVIASIQNPSNQSIKKSEV